MDHQTAADHQTEAQTEAVPKAADHPSAAGRWEAQTGRWEAQTAGPTMRHQSAADPSVGPKAVHSTEAQTEGRREA